MLRDYLSLHPFTGSKRCERPFRIRCKFVVPESRVVKEPDRGRSVANPQVSRLHHRYQREAAPDATSEAKYGAYHLPGRSPTW